VAEVRVRHLFGCVLSGDSCPIGAGGYFGVLQRPVPGVRASGSSGPSAGCYKAIECQGQGAIGCGGACASPVRSRHGAPGHEEHQKDVIERNVATQRSGSLGVGQGTFHQVGNTPSVTFKLRINACVGPRQFTEGVEIGHVLDETSEQDEECTRVTGAFPRDPADVLELLFEDLRYQGGAIGKIAVEGRLAHSSATGHLTHGNVGRFGEELAGGIDNCATITPGVLSELTVVHLRNPL
jgi:hypothetical protein